MSKCTQEEEDSGRKEFRLSSHHLTSTKYIAIEENDADSTTRCVRVATCCRMLLDFCCTPAILNLPVIYPFYVHVATHRQVM